jgi:hypothetical protein
MIRNSFFLAAILIVGACSSSKKASTGMGGKGWISLFDGKTLNGWKASGKPGSFSVVDGTIKVAGPTSHLFYEGEVMNHNFKNFEIKAQIKTMPGANSGLYFHTEFQENGFPDKGFEVQVNNSHTDWKRTAGLYDIVDTREVYVKDSVWFTMSIRVEGKHVVTKINDKTIVDWTEPGGAAAPKGHTGRVISSGTFAIQAHDPKSIVFFRDILVKPLP